MPRFFIDRPVFAWVIALGVLLGGIIALRALPIGSAYAVWTGIGTIGTAIVGIVWFAEAATLARLAFIGLIVVGIAGLKLTS